MNESGKPRIVARWESPVEGSATARALIEGALRVLEHNGLRGATSRGIAAAAGVNLGAITYHFGSKDELVARALLETVRGWLAPALEILRSDLDPPERLVGAIAELQRTFAEARNMLPVYLEALVEAPRNDTLRAGVMRLFAEVRSFLAAQLRDQRDSGELPTWIDPEAFAMLFVATADGIGLHAAIEPDAVEPDALAAQAIQLLLAARGTES